jgi:hypothetical protein
MAQLSKIAESFLDGFGCLGAIFEPCVRPGSFENLIRQDPPEVEDAELARVAFRAPRGGHLIWYFLASLAAVTSYVALSTWVHSTANRWESTLIGVIAVGLCSQFLRELVEILLAPHRNHSRSHRAKQEEASYRA